MLSDRVCDVSPSTLSVSKAKQSAMGTAATIALTWEADKSIITAVEPIFGIHTNEGTLGGGREWDRADQGNIEPFDFAIKFPKLEIGQLAWCLAYLTGGASAAAQIIGSVYKNAGSMMGINTKNLPWFTGLLCRGGTDYGVDKLLLYDLQAKSLDVEWDRGSDFVTASLNVQASGKFKRNIRRQIVWGATNATTITLVADGVFDASTPTAAVRLASIHSVLADWAGTGTNCEDVTATAASADTPAALTITPANRFDQVYTDISNVITDYTNGQSAVTLALTTTAHVYLGSYRRFNCIGFTATVANDQAATPDVEYYKTDGTWANASGIEDKTASPAGTTMGQSGNILYTMPIDWAKVMLPRGDIAISSISKRRMFWARISGSGALKATTAGTFLIGTYENCDKVFGYDASIGGGTYTDFTSAAGTATSGEFPAAQIETADHFYFKGAGGSAAGVYITIGATPNAVAASVMDVEYYNGAWGSVVAISDGTDTAGVTMSKDGAVTWTQPTDHALSTVNSVEGYWFRINFDKQLTAGAYFDGLRVGPRYIHYGVTYRVVESVNFTEGATVPTETVEFPIVKTGVRLTLGGVYDATLDRIEGGLDNHMELTKAKINIARNNPAAQFLLDGTLDRFAKKHSVGNPVQKLTMTIETDHDTWQLINAFTDANPGNSAVGTTKKIPVGVEFIGPVIDATSSALERYIGELAWPRAVMSTYKRGEANGLFAGDIEIAIGEDATNGYASCYYSCINEESTGYAQ